MTEIKSEYIAERTEALRTEGDYRHLARRAIETLLDHEKYQDIQGLFSEEVPA